MKKTYTNPTLVVIKIKAQQLLAGSPGMGGDYNGASILSREEDMSDDY